MQKAPKFAQQYTHSCLRGFWGTKAPPTFNIKRRVVFFYFGVQFEICQYQEKSNGAIYLSRYHTGIILDCKSTKHENVSTDRMQRAVITTGMCKCSQQRPSDN